MGFPIELCKEAIIQANNELEKAIDIACQLMKEKQKAHEVTNKKVKISWMCSGCTFINSNGLQICDMC